MIKKSMLWVIGLLILTIPTFWSLLRPGYFPMQDDLQAFRIYEMDKCFQNLQIPCRWVPDMGYGYGYPQFNFYSPAVFYLGEVFHLLGLQFIDSVKLLFILGFVLSALTMFVFLQSILGKLPAFVGAVLYTYVPFKAAQVYVRGSLAEFWALVIFPLLFWSSYQLIISQKKRYGFWFAISVALMFLTHNLLSLLIFPVLAIWCLVLLGIERKWAVSWWLGGFGLLGLGLASFFVLPALLEKQYVHTETLLSGYFDYRQHFVPLQKLFLSNEWGYGSSNLGQTETLNLSTGIVQWVLGLTGFIMTIIFWKKEKKTSILTFVIGMLTFFSLFMIHQRSSFIWSLIPGLNWLQFPWRFLALSAFFLSFLGATVIYYLSRWQRNVIIITFIIIITIIFSTVGFFHPKDWFNISDQEKFSGPSWEKQLTISIFDYLPIYSKFPPNKKAPEKPEILEGDAAFSSYIKQSDSQIGLVSAGQNATIRLPLFDFPGMKVEVDGQEVSHIHDDCRFQEYCLGLITFNIPVGSQKVVTKLGDTPIRTTGNIITIFSVIVLIGLFLTLKKKLQL